MRIQLIGLLFLSTIAAGCSSSDQKNSAKVYPFYFDFEQEINRLESENTQVRKYLKSDEDVDTLELSPDWKDELKLFVDADINSKAIEADYKIDSVWNGEQLKIILSTINEDLETKSVTHYFRDGKLELVEMEILRSDLLRTGEYKLNYVPNKGYSIKAQLEIPFLMIKVLSLKAEFVD